MIDRYSIKNVIKRNKSFIEIAIYDLQLDSINVIDTFWNEGDYEFTSMYMLDTLDEIIHGKELYLLKNNYIELKNKNIITNICAPGYSDAIEVYTFTFKLLPSLLLMTL